MNELFDYGESVLYRALESNNPYSRDTNIFFSENDIYCNFWQFEQELVHFCFIIGFSGSGKSTLAKQLAKKYHAQWAELDVLIYDSINHDMTENFVEKSQKQKLLMKYIKDQKVDLSYMKNLADKNYIANDARPMIIQTGKKYVDWLTTINKDRCCISGIDLIDILPMNPQWYAAPIIFKGTSRVKSILRRYMRGGKSTKLSISMIPTLLRWYHTDAKGIDYLRNTVITKYNSQERNEQDLDNSSRSSHTRTNELL